jgi:hypothetical protein
MTTMSDPEPQPDTEPDEPDEEAEPQEVAEHGHNDPGDEYGDADN